MSMWTATPGTRVGQGETNILLACLEVETSLWSNLVKSWVGTLKKDHNMPDIVK